MVAQGYTQEVGIDYDEVFAPVVRIEAIRLFLAYASFMGFIMYQMDVKSAFLYGTIEKEVRGTIDKALFIKKDKGDILLVQVYVDEIIFGSTKKTLCVEFEQMMHKRFQMSSIGELTFFLGLQVKQKDDGIFISQDKYVADILKKFDFVTVKTSSTPIETNKALLKDEEAEDVDVHLYKSMIGSLMYLTSSRPDIMFVVCACARDSPFDLEAFSDSDYAGSSLDRKSTTRDGISDKFGVKTGSCKVNDARQDLVLLGENGNADFHEIVDFLTTSPIHYALTQIQATIDGKIVVISESSMMSDLHFNDEDGITCLTNETIFENLVLMGYESDSDKLTFQKALFSPQWKYLIHTILHCLCSKSTSWNEFSTNIAFAVICLANGQKFNFSKLIFNGMLRNLDTNTKKFLMYLRFLQLFLNNQISLVEPFNDIYKTPVHTKKVFTNMKRKGKDFSGRITPLFASMWAPPVVEGEGSGQPTEPQLAPSTTQPIIEEQIPVTKSSSPQNTQTPRQALQEDTQLPQTSVHIPNVADEAVFAE
ncbi:putative ribonuclease H-like domain-containing protein [Tanacetum coccineum]